MAGNVVRLERGLGDDTAPLWRALADPTRRRILDLLRERPLITGEIAAQFPISRIAVTRHLEVLAKAGLIGNRKRAGGVVTVSTLSRWGDRADAGRDRSRPASLRDSSTPIAQRSGCCLQRSSRWRLKAQS